MKVIITSAPLILMFTAGMVLGLDASDIFGKSKLPAFLFVLTMFLGIGLQALIVFGGL